MGQSQAARAQATFQNKQYAQTSKIAGQNYLQELSASGLQDQQNIAAVSQAAGQNALQAAQIGGTANVAAGEQGVTGNSVNELFMDYDRLASINRTNLGTNLSWQRQQLGQEQLSLYGQARSRVAGSAPGPVQMPSALATALQIGSAALDTGVRLDSYYNPKNPNYVGRRTG